MRWAWKILDAARKRLIWPTTGPPLNGPALNVNLCNWMQLGELFGRRERPSRPPDGHPDWNPAACAISVRSAVRFLFKSGASGRFGR